MTEFHTTLTQWKNRLGFEVFGQNSYALVEGPGGSVSLDLRTRSTLSTRGQNLPAGRWEEFTAAIREEHKVMASGADAVETIRVAQAPYRSAKVGEPLQIAELRQMGVSGSASP